MPPSLNEPLTLNCFFDLTHKANPKHRELVFDKPEPQLQNLAILSVQYSWQSH